MSKSAQVRVFTILIMALAVCLASAATAHAQATRTWVSGVGDDANPCSRTAPCKTFAGAISKTAPCGEIDVLDPGGFGALTITKCISIENDDGIAGVLVSGTNGFIVQAGATDRVMIRGLTFEGLNLTNQFQVQYVDSVGDRINYFHQQGREYFLGFRFKL